MKPDRQGDVVLVKIKEMPSPDQKYQGHKWREKEDTSLTIKGEQGHSHIFWGVQQLMVPEFPPRGFNIVAIIKLGPEGGKVTHTQEGNPHGTLEEKEGVYEVRQGREYENPRAVD